MITADSFLLHMATDQEEEEEKMGGSQGSAQVLFCTFYFTKLRARHSSTPDRITPKAPCLWDVKEAKAGEGDDLLWSSL